MHWRYIPAYSRILRMRLVFQLLSCRYYLCTKKSSWLFNTKLCHLLLYFGDFLASCWTFRYTVLRYNIVSNGGRGETCQERKWIYSSINTTVLCISLDTSKLGIDLIFSVYNWDWMIVRYIEISCIQLQYKCIQLKCECIQLQCECIQLQSLCIQLQYEWIQLQCECIQLQYESIQLQRRECVQLQYECIQIPNFVVSKYMQETVKKDEQVVV